MPFAGELLQRQERTGDDAQVNAAGQAELHGLGGVLSQQQFFVIDHPYAGIGQRFPGGLAVRGVFRVGD